MGPARSILMMRVLPRPRPERAFDWDISGANGGRKSGACSASVRRIPRGRETEARDAARGEGPRIGGRPPADGGAGPVLRPPPQRGAGSDARAGRPDRPGRLGA